MSFAALAGFPASKAQPAQKAPLWISSVGKGQFSPNCGGALHGGCTEWQGCVQVEGAEVAGQGWVATL